jgi:Lon protease-like protein
MQGELLPLFPLSVVLLPRAELPLHVFEERYKQMIGEAIQGKTEFGVVLAAGESIVNTGCTALVERVVRQYPDGRMDIVSVGRRRFEIFLLNQEKEYLRAAVHFFDDEQAEPASVQLRQQALEVYQKLPESGELDDPTILIRMTPSSASCWPAPCRTSNSGRRC